MSEPTSGSSFGRNRGRPTSSRWLFAAIVITALAATLTVAMLAGITRWPAQDTQMEPPTPSDVVETLTVAVARTPGGPGEWDNWTRVIKNISEETGRPVSVRYLSDEGLAAQQIATQDIDIAFVCAHHYLDLRDAGEIIGLVTPVLGGDTSSTLMLIVRADDSAERFEDLQASAIAASDKSSLGGYAYLAYLAMERDVNLIDYFSELRLGDTQESNLRALIDGEIRATVVNSVQVLDWDMTRFKVIEESPPYGLPPIVVDEQMSPELADEILEILLEMDPAMIADADTLIEGFEPIDDAEYDFAAELREACGSHDHP